MTAPGPKKVPDTLFVLPDLLPLTYCLVPAFPPALRFAFLGRFALCNSTPRGDIGKYSRMLQLGENHELDSFRS